MEKTKIYHDMIENLEKELERCYYEMAQTLDNFKDTLDKAREKTGLRKSLYDIHKSIDKTKETE